MQSVLVSGSLLLLLSCYHGKKYAPELLNWPRPRTGGPAAAALALPFLALPSEHTPPPHVHHGQGSRGTLLRRRSASSSLLCPSN
jgi:hypothetical protein